MLLRKLLPDRQKLLISKGVSAGDFIHSKTTKVEIEEHLVKYESNVFGVMPKTVGSGKQLNALEKVFAHPLGNYVLGISSFPSDVLAKHLAISLMDKACTAWQVSKNKRGKSMPVWHRVYGGYYDTLRDRISDDRPSMLVLSNITPDLTNIKLEKIRDLLEKYNDIPRIVVMSGEDPLTFFGNRLHYPINVGILLGPHNRVEHAKNI